MLDPPHPQTLRLGPVHITTTGRQPLTSFSDSISVTHREFDTILAKVFDHLHLTDDEGTQAGDQLVIHAHFLYNPT